MSLHHILISGCLLLAGCDGAERICDGFHHPLAEIWTENNGLGEVRTFAGSKGSQRNFVLESVSCYEEADYLYVESNSDVAFSFDFVQEDVRADSAIENQIVRMYVDVQNPVGTSVENIQLTEFWLSDPELIHGQLDSSDENSNLFIINYIPEATINGVAYTDLLQHEFIDNSGRFTRGEVLDDAKWVRMLLAKDVGLLQYELLSGEVFTLIRN